MKNHLPRLTIGAATSGTGKTLLTSLLGRLLSKKGYAVQPFKCGPDYIDPSYHSVATGNICRNLDTRLIPENAVLELFERQAAGADISLIEGVMGLYDGAGALDERGSTAHLSKLIKSPVILLMDVSSMARSAAAIALGYRDFDPDVNVAGFILNRVASPRHEQIVRAAVEDCTGLPVLGAIPRNSTFAMPERHLGLVPAWEDDEILRFLDSGTALLEESIDLEAILRIARSAGALQDYQPTVFNTEPAVSGPGIAYAYDRAFHFYYEDNLDLLRHKGARLVPFSPINDEQLPVDISGIYIGGGYPELSAAELSSNKAMLSAVKKASSKGMPIWGECGGLMYLSEGITGFNGETHAMAGIIPGRAIMKKGLRALGYYTGKLRADSWMGTAGDEIIGHVFHWSKMTDIAPSALYQLKLKKDNDPAADLEDGFCIGNTWAGYMHIHFASNHKPVDNFIKACLKWQGDKS
ncbi:MAG TPA: cobyrinic acid a,c-diamide synthase [Spirochaeta sp.]|nr:cobyrinic acid a,c-diamide synthase [Spirochaeta sp.]